jgi:hypothetical protein
MNGADPLTALRPLHEPPPIPWWPPAPGWWLLSSLLLILVLLGIWWWRTKAVQRSALRELKALQDLQDDPVQLAASVNRLLKRYTRACWPAAKDASLCGQAWLEFLDARGGGGAFTEGPGRLLLSLPYASPVSPQPPSGTPDVDQIVSLARRWIKHNRPGRGR